QAADRVAALWVYPVAACLSARLSRLAKTGRADFGGDMCPAGPGLDSVDGRGGQRGETVAQAWADIPAARRDGEARGGVLCRGVSDEQGRTDQGIQGRISSPTAGGRAIERTGFASAGSRDRRGGRRCDIRAFV